MSGTSKLTRQMTVITHSIVSEFFITDVTKSGVIINQFIMHCHYHTFWELKLFINVFDILFKCVYKRLSSVQDILFKCVYETSLSFNSDCM